MVTYPIQRLTPADAPSLAALSQAIGWHINRNDWRQLLQWSGPGAYGIYHAYKGDLLASTLSFLYEDQRAWLGGVLTHPGWQGHGLATRLLETALKPLERRGVAEIMLDASPQGRPLYARYGFRDLYTMQRFVGTVQAPDALSDAILPVSHDDLPALVALDAEIFGAPRRRVLLDLLKLGWVVPDDAGGLRGALLADILPNGKSRIHGWWAHDPDTAADLFDHARAALAGRPLQLDVPGPNPIAGRLCLAAGLAPDITNQRMIRGEQTPSGAPERYYAAIRLAVG